MKVLICLFLLSSSALATEASDNMARNKEWRDAHNKRCPAPKTAACVKEFSDFVDREDAQYQSWKSRQDVREVETKPADSIQTSTPKVMTCINLGGNGVETLDCY